MDEPLIYTSKGNLPVNSLRQVVTWQDGPSFTKCIETYYDGDEIVKQSAHVMVKSGLSAAVEAGEFS